MNQRGYYSRKVRAGKRTYFFDVRATRNGDFFMTITESKKKHNDSGFDNHKVFIYKE
ncbi:MAG TPA: DNA-binding protein, partial [Bacteroidetes bacterium]|nr:DNA-binding protein [Bacteroidota bacterium]